MNCEKGDIAIVVRSYAGNHGKIVTCLKLHPPGSFNLQEIFGPVWEVDAKMNIIWGDDISMGEIYGMPDSFLRPLRDQDGEDEMLRIVGLPNKSDVSTLL